MRIAAVYRNDRRGGAYKSLSVLLDYLRGRHEVSEENMACPVYSYNAAAEMGGTAKRIFDRMENKPDLVITQGTIAPAVIRQTRRYGAKTVVMLRGLDLFCYANNHNRSETLRKCHKLCFLCARGKRRLYFPLYLYRALKSRFMLHKANLIIANSNFVREISESLGFETYTVYPPVQPVERINGKREYILGINTSTNETDIKGIGNFIEIARQMPSERFAIAGKFLPYAESSSGRKPCMIDMPPNCEYLGWVDDMSGIFAKAKMFISPTNWEEPFGRVFVEAYQQDTPVLTFNKGGAVEVVQDKRYLLPDGKFAVEAWVNAAKSILEFRLKPDVQFTDIAERFSSKRHITAFRALVKHKMGFDL